MNQNVVDGKESRELNFWLNGAEVVLTQVDPAQMLISYLREQGLTGTKLGCGQGGCGACTVILSRYNPSVSAIEHLAINACLRPLVSIHGMAVTTIEGVGSMREGLSAVQYRIAAHNGSQCGFCTPGFVMNMTAFLKSNPNPKAMEIEKAFDGNLCRCTGYRPILEGMRTFAKDLPADSDGSRTCFVDPAFRVEENTKDWTAPVDKAPGLLSITHDTGSPVWVQAESVADIYTLQEKYRDSFFHNIRLVVGNTATGVCDNRPDVFIDISRIPELTTLKATDDGIEAGAAVSIQRLLDFVAEQIAGLPKKKTAGLKALRYLVRRLASIQVRNTGSIGGNIYLAAIFEVYLKSVYDKDMKQKYPHPDMEAMFVSDLFTAFAALGVTLTMGVAAPGEKPSLKTYTLLDLPTMDSFFYQKQSIVFLSFSIPYSNPKEYFRTFKVARRLENGQGAVNAGFRVQLDDNNKVADTTLLYGGLGFKTVAAAETAAYLQGKPWDEKTLAGSLAVLNKELKTLAKPLPITGYTQTYRRALAENLFYKFFLYTARKADTAEVNPVNVSAAKHYKRPLSTARQAYPTYPEKYPVSRPMIKMMAFFQASGEAKYTHDEPLPFNGVYGAMVTNPTHAVAAFTYSCTYTPDEKGASPKTVTGLEAVIAHVKETKKGVVDFVTVVDIPKGGQNLIGPGNDDPVFSDGVATYVGAPIGLVVAESQEAATDAAQYIRDHCITFTKQETYPYEGETVPAVVTLEQGIEQGTQFKQFPETCPDLSHIPSITRPGSDEAWLENPDTPPAGDTFCARGEAACGFQAHFYMETQSALVIPNGEDQLVVRSSTQDPDGVQAATALVLNMPANKIRVEVARVGGGFGGKQVRCIYTSGPAAVAAWKLGRAVKLVLPRDLDTTSVGKRHPFLGSYEVACSMDGAIKGMKTLFQADGGNSYDVSFPVMDLAQLLADNAYNIPTFQTTGQIFRTNLASNTAFRSFGVVQGMLIQEDAIEMTAFELGKRLKKRVLPEEIREKNFYRTGSLKDYDVTPYGQDLMYCNIKEIWDELKLSSDFDRRVGAVEAFNKENQWRKRGISMIPLKYGIAYTGPRGTLNQGYALVNIYHADGSVLVNCGGVELGQGLNTKMAQIAAQTLGIPLKKVRVATVSTNSVPNPTATASSTGSDLNGGAVEKACKALRTRLEEFCIRLEEFRPHPKNKQLQGLEKWRTNWKEIWGDLVSAAYTYRVNLSAQAHYKTPHYSSVDIDFPTGHPFFYFTYAAAVSEVEIDVLTGETAILRSDILFDNGQSLNPCVDVGQVEGAFVQGIGYVTTEELLFNDDGKLLTDNTWNYKVPFSRTIPQDFRVTLKKSETKEEHDGLRLANSAVKSSKGIGEPPLVLASSVFFAIRHAVIDARKDAGDDNWFRFDAPATPQRIQAACLVNPDKLTL